MALLIDAALDDTLAPMKRIGAAKAGRGDALSSPATRASGFTHRNSRSSWSAVPDPVSASIAGRKTGVPSDVLWPRPLRGLLPPDQVRGSQALTPPRGSGSWFSWSLLREVGPAGRLRSAKTMDALRRIGAAQSPRSGRSIAQLPRSGLTATGQCGRQPEMCEGRRLAGRGVPRPSTAARRRSRSPRSARRLAPHKPPARRRRRRAGR